MHCLLIELAPRMYLFLPLHHPSALRLDPPLLLLTIDEQWILLFFLLSWSSVPGLCDTRFWHLERMLLIDCKDKQSKWGKKTDNWCTPELAKDTPSSRTQIFGSFNITRAMACKIIVHNKKGESKLQEIRSYHVCFKGCELPTYHTLLLPATLCK